MELTRDAAWALLTEHTKSESLIKHALGVEAAVRGYARLWGEDEESWGFVALVHQVGTGPKQVYQLHTGHLLFGGLLCISGNQPHDIVVINHCRGKQHKLEIELLNFGTGIAAVFILLCF